MAKEVKIRCMNLDDLDQVMEIEKRSFYIPWCPKTFQDAISREHSFYLVATVDDNMIVGYTGMMGVVDEGQIENLAVHESYRRMGIGSMLFQQLFEIGLLNGIYNYTLEVRRSNDSAIRLYKKLGFTEAGYRKNYYALPKEDALIMWKYFENTEQLQ